MKIPLFAVSVPMANIVIMLVKLLLLMMDIILPSLRSIVFHVPLAMIVPLRLTTLPYAQSENTPSKEQKAAQHAVTATTAPAAEQTPNALQEQSKQERSPSRSTTAKHAASDK